jgi:hypothetical protein
MQLIKEIKTNLEYSTKEKFQQNCYHVTQYNLFFSEEQIQSESLLAVNLTTLFSSFSPDFTETIFSTRCNCYCHECLT